MSSKRRKQQQPRHIIQDPFLLTQTLENEITCEFDTTPLRSYDNHICGRCCAEFYTMPAFLLHKKHCTNEWPVIFTTTDDDEVDEEKPCDDAEADDNVVDDELNHRRRRNNSNNSPDDVQNENEPPMDCNVNSNNVAQIQTALASLQRQQLLQLQLIQQIYSQLLGDKANNNGVGSDSATVCNDAENQCDSTTSTTFDSLKMQVMTSLKEMEHNVTQQINEQRKADSCLDRLYRNKCQLCGKFLSNVEQLQNHLRTVHSKELSLPYACQKCDERFATPDEMNEHMDDIHRKINDDDGVMDSDDNVIDDDARPKSYPFLYNADVVDDRDGAKTDPGTYRTTYKPTPNDSEMSTASTPENSIYTGNDDDLTNSVGGHSPMNSPNDDYDQKMARSFAAACESSPLDLSANPTSTMQTPAKSTAMPSAVHSSTVIGESTAKFDPYRVFANFSSNNNNNSHRMKSPTGDMEDDWESLMEIQNTDEAAKIRQLVGDKDTKVTDPNQCIICHRILSCKSALQMHYRTHTGTRPFKCKVCQRAFTTKGNLKTHMGVHRTKPPFRLFHQCPVCHKRFTNGLVLQQHIRLHIGQPLEISLDQIQAAEIKDADNSRSTSPTTASPEEYIDMRSPPIRTNGSISAPLPPSLASLPHPPQQPQSSAATISDNNKRPSAKHTEAEKSSDGDYNFGSGSISASTPISSEQQVHRKVFSFSPANCQFPMGSGGEPASPIPLQLHSPLTLPGSNPYTAVMGPTPHQVAMMSGRPSTTCNICFKTFACYSALEIHYRSHTKERPFKCDVCGRGFSTKGNMKQHLLTHKIRDMPPHSHSFDRTTNDDDSGDESSRSSTTNRHMMSGSKSENGRSDSVYDNDDSSTSMKFASFHHQQQQNSFAEPDEILNSDDVPTTTRAGGDGNCNGSSSSNGPTPLESIQKMWAKTETLAASAAAADSSSASAKKSPIFNKHQCQLCYKNFSSASALQIHMRTHTGDRPFSCKICSRAFTTKGNLKVHMGTHMWTNTNRRGRRIFDMPNASGVRSSKSIDDISDDNEDTKTVTISTSASKNGDLDDMKSSNNSFRFDDSSATTPTTKSKLNSFHHLPPFCSPNVSQAILSQLQPRQTSSSSTTSASATNFPHLDSLPPGLAPHLIPNPFSPTFAAGFSPYTSSTLSQLNPFAHAMNGAGGRPTSSSSGGDSSMEAMLLMWRTVCSVCHKVCASASELEDHLKHHLGQVGVDRKTPLQT